VDSLNKKLLIALVIVVIAVVAVIVGIFVLPGAFVPPVDTSGVNLPITMTTEELLPAELAGQSLAENETGDATVDTGTGSFSVEETWALYDPNEVYIIKAHDQSDALDTLNVIYEDWFGSGSGTRTKTTNWFKCDIDGICAFFWRSDVWVFGVVAGDGTTRQQAAEDFVQHLNDLSV
jgi:hypothetical protein